MSDNTALLAGFTKEIIADTNCESLHLFVRPGDYLDGSFRAYDADNCEFVTVHGDLIANIEVITQQDEVA